MAFQPIHHPTEWLLLEGETLRTDPEENIPEHPHLIHTHGGACQKIILTGGQSYCYRLEITCHSTENEDMGLWVHGPLEEEERQTPVWDPQTPPFPTTPVSHNLVFTCPKNGEYYVGFKRNASSHSIIEVISFSVQSNETLLRQQIDKLITTNKNILTQLHQEQHNRREWEKKYTILIQETRRWKEARDQKFNDILEKQTDRTIFLRRQLDFLQQGMQLFLDAKPPISQNCVEADKLSNSEMT